MLVAVLSYLDVVVGAQVEPGRGERGGRGAEGRAEWNDAARGASAANNGVGGWAMPCARGAVEWRRELQNERGGREGEEEEGSPFGRPPASSPSPPSQAIEPPRPRSLFKLLRPQQLSRFAPRHCFLATQTERYTQRQRTDIARYAPRSRPSRSCAGRRDLDPHRLAKVGHAKLVGRDAVHVARSAQALGRLGHLRAQEVKRSGGEESKRDGRERDAPPRA